MRYRGKIQNDAGICKAAGWAAATREARAEISTTHPADYGTVVMSQESRANKGVFGISSA
jgi:hypothetical protein